MQRRAAAIYVAFFLIVGAASYSLIATAEEPTISFDNPEQRLQENDTFTVQGQQYTVQNLEASMEGGGHGSAATLSRSGTIAWTNQSAVHTATWENNSSITYDSQQYRVLIPNQTDPSSFTLQEEINRTRILQSDQNADNQTITRNGQQYVVVTDNGTQRLVPASEYFPEPNTTSFQEGQTIDYDGNQTTISNVSADAATLQWTAPQTNTVEISDESNVTLGGQTYLAYFPNNETVLLTQDFESYRTQSESIESYHEHVNGLWGVTILSFAVAVLLLAMAYMPSRY